MFEAPLRITRYYIEAPGQFSCLSIVGGEKSACAKIGAAVANDHVAIDDKRRAGDREVRQMARRVRFPDSTPCLCIEGNQATVERPHVDLPFPHRDTAIDCLAAAIHLPLPRNSRIEPPKRLASPGIEGEDTAKTRRGIENAIHDNRSG